MIGVDRTGKAAAGRVGALWIRYCLASASGDQSVRLWDAATGRELDQPCTPDDEVFSVAFDPAGARLAAGSKSHVVLWDLRNGARLSV